MTEGDGRLFLCSTICPFLRAWHAHNFFSIRFYNNAFAVGIKLFSSANSHTIFINVHFAAITAPAVNVHFAIHFIILVFP